MGNAARHAFPAAGGNLLVVAHDAGGAELVSSWLRHHPEYPARCVVEGPAAAIFMRKIPALARHSGGELSRLIRESDFVLTGTGWASGLECSAVRFSREAGIPVVSYLDHWVNYRERFLFEGELCLPDELWVGDRYAHEIARRTFPATPIHDEPNPYFEDVLEEVSRIPIVERDAGELRVLYLCEPIADQVRQGFSPEVGYDEFDALNHALARLLVEQPAHLGIKIRVRLHPAEPPGKYDAILARFDADAIEVSSGSTLIEDCARADWVVGCESTAMVIALLARRRVLCAIPPGGMPCRLPHAGIEQLTSLGLAREKAR